MITTPEALKVRFATAGITDAAIIDDAFDEQMPVKMAMGSVDEFWAEIQDKNEWRTLLDSKNISYASKEVLIADGLKQIWNERANFNGGLSTFISGRLFSRANENLLAPEKVLNYIKTDLGVANVVVSPGSNSAAQNVPTNVRLVFLDYNLEEEEAGKSVLIGDRRSVRIAKMLLLRGASAPFLVLYSSKIGDTDAEEFRLETGYLRGTFLFISKNDAINLAHLCDKLGGSCVENPDLGKLQYFFLCLQGRLKEVTSAIEKDVMQLDVQDYAFLQRMALQEDGAPLGDYLLSLFGNVLSYNLRDGEKVLAAQHELDKLYFGERHLPFSSQPSMPVKKLYKACLTEPGVGKMKPHSQAENGKLEDAKGHLYSAPPLLMLGDIFAVSQSKPVYAVMNPACDLQYSPKNKKRQPDLAMTVYLLCGRLETLDSPLTPKTQKRLEMLEFKNKYWRVRWYRDEVMAIPLGKMQNWKRTTGYDRIARLSSIQALSLQNFWAGNLTRVGLPVSLPFYDSCVISVYFPNKDNNGWRKKTGDSQGQAIVVRHPKSSTEPIHFTLTWEGGRYLYKCLQQELAKLKDKRKSSAQALIDQASLWQDITTSPSELKRIEADRQNRCLIQTNNPQRQALVFIWNAKPKPEDLNKYNKEAAAIVVLSSSESP